MKKPWLAFTLSFLLPGAGLAYLGKWGWGLVNLLAVLAIGVGLALLLPAATFHHFIRLVGYGCAGGSGGLAQWFAAQMNQQAKPGVGKA